LALEGKVFPARVGHGYSVLEGLPSVLGLINRATGSLAIFGEDLHLDRWAVFQIMTARAGALTTSATHGYKHGNDRKACQAPIMKKPLKGAFQSVCAKDLMLGDPPFNERPVSPSSHSHTAEENAANDDEAKGVLAHIIPPVSSRYLPATLPSRLRGYKQSGSGDR
jgi:hypothetical protein